MELNAFQKVVLTIDDLVLKLRLIFSTVMGWGMMFMMFVAATFGVKAQLFHCVLLALFIDLFFGCWSSLKVRKFKISIALYSTAVKLVMYFVLFFMPLVLEKVLINNDISIGTVFVTALLCAAEFFSVCAHMLIIKPDLPAVKMMKKLLSGEIAHKLGVHEDDVENYFKQEEK